MISIAEAVTFLNYFCDEDARTDYAVLIDAPWGAGKTHFIKTYLVSRDAEARKKDASSGAPFLYASFYGVSTVDEIREQFFIQAYPLLASVPVKMIGTALAGVVKKFTGAEFTPDQMKGKLPLEAKVLVFDDLERAAMPLVEALGLINTFVEHGDHKVVVIANQAEVPESQKADYNRQREKIIGRTLAISADPGEVLNELIGEMRSSEARTAAEANREIIIRIFNASERLNLRSLRAAIDDFDRLVRALDRKLASKPEALRQLLSYMVAVEIECRAGLAREELDALLSRFAFGDQTREINMAETVRAKYPEVEWRDPIVPAETLADYLLTGVLNVEAANEAILMHPLIAEPKTLPAWRRLISWQLRGPASYRTDREDVLRDLAARKIIDPGEICHVIGIAIWLERMGESLLGDVEADMRRYIDAIEAAGKLMPERSVFGGSSFSDGWAGITYCCPEDPRFVRIKRHLEAAVGRVFDKAMKAEAPALMDQLRRPGGDGKAIFDASPGSGYYGGVAILHHIPVGDFADVLLDDGRANRKLFAALTLRYQYWGSKPEMLVERPWLERLRCELDTRADALGAPFNRALKQSWAKPFAEAFGMLDVGRGLAAAERTQDGDSSFP